MVSREFIFWEVDVQADFMLPGGNLYVPGAEKLLPNIRRLTDAARQGRVFLVSHGCFHTPDDPEFKVFPPHCVKGTAGAELVPEALAEKVVRVPNDTGARFPEDFSRYQQILLEKQTLNIFESRHADGLVERLGRHAEFVVFGVVTEYCVSFAVKGLRARGRRVAVVQDAIETLKREDGQKTMAELERLGARLTRPSARSRAESLAVALVMALVVVSVAVTVIVTPGPVLLLLLGRQLAEVAVAIPVRLLGPAMVVNIFVPVPRVIVGVVGVINAIGVVLGARESCQRRSQRGREQQRTQRIGTSTHVHLLGE
jgi:nicotinamidase/pyrazinamidase